MSFTEREELLSKAMCWPGPDLRCLCDLRVWYAMIAVYERFGAKGVKQVVLTAVACCTPDGPKPEPRPPGREDPPPIIIIETPEPEPEGCELPPLLEV